MTAVPQHRPDLWMLRLPRVKVRRTTDTAALATGATVAVTWQTADYDTDGMWDAGAPTRITAVTDGLLRLASNVEWDGSGNTTGQRTIQIRDSSGAPIASDRGVAPTNTTGTGLYAADEIEVSAGDWFDLAGFQNSTVSVKILGSAAGPSWFAARMVALL